MSYLVFARKWRPQTFEEIVGQGHVTTTLKNAILQNRVAHAYLFSGPRGVGKTTTARILAKALNCQSAEHPLPVPCNKCDSCIEISEGRSLDVIEIDGASNRGIDEIRQLRENVKFGPSKGRYKVYIIDEVHQVTDPGFNALLKTLEEPPPHIKFVFATTHRHKVIPTILSRCQRFDFKRIPTVQLVEKLKAIAKIEKVDIDEEALFLIARAADGSVRDAESTLDQLVSFSCQRIRTDTVVSMLGTVEQETFFEITRLIIDKDTEAALQFINKFTNEGKDLLQFVNGLLEHFRNLAIAKIQKQPSGLLIDLPKDVVEKIFQQSQQLDLLDVIYIFNILSSTHDAMRKSGFSRIYLEMAIIKLIKRDLHKEPVKSAQKPRPDVSPARADTPQIVVEPPKAVVENIPDNVTVDFSRQDIDYAIKKSREANVSTAVEEGPAMPVLQPASIEEVRNAWPELLKRVKLEKISAALFLMEGIVSQTDGDSLIINFSPHFVFYKEALERIENKRIIEKHLKDILGKQISLKFCISDTEPEVKAAQIVISDDKNQTEPVQNIAKTAVVSGPKPVAGDTAQQPKDSVENRDGTDSIVSSALEIFRARIVRKE